MARSRIAQRFTNVFRSGGSYGRSAHPDSVIGRSGYPGQRQTGLLTRIVSGLRAAPRTIERKVTNNVWGRLPLRTLTTRRIAGLGGISIGTFMVAMYAAWYFIL